MKAKVTLPYRDVREAEAVSKALTPDNLKVPPGLFIETKRVKFRVHTLVRCETRLETFIATLDDLLSCASVAERILSTTKRLEAS